MRANLTPSPVVFCRVPHIDMVKKVRVTVKKRDCIRPRPEPVFAGFDGFLSHLEGLPLFFCQGLDGSCESLPRGAAVSMPFPCSTVLTQDCSPTTQPRSPLLAMRDECDGLCTPAGAVRLCRTAVRAPSARRVRLPRRTHLLHLEIGRHALDKLVGAFQANTWPKGPIPMARFAGTRPERHAKAPSLARGTAVCSPAATTPETQRALLPVLFSHKAGPCQGCATLRR